MKTFLTNRVCTLLAVAGLFLLLFSACKKKSYQPASNTISTTAQLSGANEVPAVNTTGTGTANITYDKNAKTIAYTLSWQLGSSTATTTAMHFHGSETGSDATSSPVVIGINGFSTGSSGTVSGTTRALTDAEANQLMAGKWYVNVHSSNYPNGEMRGNIKFSGSNPGGPYNPSPGY